MAVAWVLSPDEKYMASALYGSQTLSSHNIFVSVSFLPNKHFALALEFSWISIEIIDMDLQLDLITNYRTNFL